MRISQVASELSAQVRVVSYKFLNEVAHPVAFSQASTMGLGSPVAVRVFGLVTFSKE